MPSHDASAEEALLERERAKRVRDLVAALPERMSQAILLRYLDELSEKEVAERLGVPQLSGVCVGLSEATGVPVVVFRLAFVALLFVKGIGLFLYVLLDLAMPVHPDDRQYLLRFKLRRMWQRRFAHADDHPR